MAFEVVVCRKSVNQFQNEFSKLLCLAVAGKQGVSFFQELEKYGYGCFQEVRVMLRADNYLKVFTDFLGGFKLHFISRSWVNQTGQVTSELRHLVSHANT